MWNESKFCFFVLFSKVLVMESLVLCMLGKCSSLELLYILLPQRKRSECLILSPGLLKRADRNCCFSFHYYIHSFTHTDRYLPVIRSIIMTIIYYLLECCYILTEKKKLFRYGSVNTSAFRFLENYYKDTYVSQSSIFLK